MKLSEFKTIYQISKQTNYHIPLCETLVSEEKNNLYRLKIAFENYAKLLPKDEYNNFHQNQTINFYNFVISQKYFELKNLLDFDFFNKEYCYNQARLYFYNRKNSKELIDHINTFLKYEVSFKNFNPYLKNQNDYLINIQKYISNYGDYFLKYFKKYNLYTQTKESAEFEYGDFENFISNEDEQKNNILFYKKPNSLLKSLSFVYIIEQEINKDIYSPWYIKELEEEHLNNQEYFYNLSYNINKEKIQKAHFDFLKELKQRHLDWENQQQFTNSFYVFNLIKKTLSGIKKTKIEEIKNYNLEFVDGTQKSLDSKKRGVDAFLPAGLCYYNDRIVLNTQKPFHIWGKSFDLFYYNNVLLHEYGHAFDYILKKQSENKKFYNNYFQKINAAFIQYKKLKNQRIHYKAIIFNRYFLQPEKKNFNNIIKTLKDGQISSFLYGAKKKSFKDTLIENFAESFAFISHIILCGFHQWHSYALNFKKSNLRAYIKLNIITISYLLENLDWSNTLGISEIKFKQEKLKINHYLNHFHTNNLNNSKKKQCTPKIQKKLYRGKENLKIRF